ncbi:MAG TPA: penicillin-binding protein 1A [Alphaproteobacteria bacterium]|nr:penicillin-binding protein 1A [Alphaproteobacteria bacterium]
MRKFFISLLVLIVFVGALGAGGFFLALWHFGRGLPNHQQLADYQPPVLTRVHAGDGRILAEFAVERRVFVPIDAIPKLVINAFLSAEDKSFYSHPGISLPDIARAAIYNAMNRGTKRPIGASTITQQVAKNFLLTNEVSLERKVKEAILAVRIEQALSKDRILELYLNEIYLGQGAYGVAAAALNYFNKPMDELTIEEAAYLAALPKAPNNYHPFRHPEAAKARRDWVISRMREDGVITEAEAEQARGTPFQVRGRGEVEVVRAEYFAEEVRRELLQRYGEAGLYGGGLSVRTTVDPRLQDIADRALRKGLITYDRRHGWRGPIARIDPGVGWERRLQAVQKPAGLPANWMLAVALDIGDKAVTVGVADGKTGTIPFSEMQWARAHREQQRLGPPVRQPSDVLNPGDVVAVEALEGDAAARQFTLRQIPNVSGGIVALDPHTGRVLAMAGGWSFELSQFNRVTQAVRQPGSAFKPFVYLPALDNGFTPSSLVLDAPIVINQGPGLPPWKPSNYSRNFFGPSPIRVGIEQSRNLMTIRLAQNIGMDKVADYVERFGIIDQLPEHLSMSLGAGETTLLKLTTAYAMLVNGGLRIKPTLIDRVQDRNGRTIFKHDPRPCDECRAQFWSNQPMPAVADMRERVIGADTAFQMVNILQGVVDRGTGRRIKEIGKPLAGKTGTTNDSNDAWFVGFSPDLAVGVFVGFDTPRTLGPNETGSSVSVPIFKDVMADALKDKPAIPFRIPPGIRLVRVNPSTGLVARPGERDVIWEAFKPGTEPVVPGPVLDGGALASEAAGTAPVPASDTGGLY